MHDSQKYLNSYTQTSKIIERPYIILKNNQYVPSPLGYTNI